jgi:hypothetical protein
MPVDAWNNKRVVKDLAVVGHGRGATSYAAYWLQKQDIRVEHERLGAQGIVESGFSVPTWGVRAGVHHGLTRDKFRFKHKIAIVRDPYKVIATYEQIEHPRAIFLHQNHIEICKDLLPPDFDQLSYDSQCMLLDNDRTLRVNAIARSVVRWTSAGIVWCDGHHFRAEDQWAEEMPGWLKERGLWALDEPNEVPKNKVNHRQGRRLSREEIADMLRPDVYQELNDYSERMGYNG